MKLVSKSFDQEDGHATVIAEESEDLWHLYNLIVAGDAIKATTYRKVVREGATGTTSAETKKLVLKIRVQKVEYDALGDCIRFSGTNIEQHPDVKMGAHHTTEITLNMKLTVEKPEWDSVHKELLADATDATRSAELCAVLMDSSGICNIYVLTAVLAKEVLRLNCNVPKKRGLGSGYDKALVRFYTQIFNAIVQHVDFDVVKCVLVAGPGFLKDDFSAWLQQYAVQQGIEKVIKNKSLFVTVSCSSCWKQGLNELLQDEGVKKRIVNTKASQQVQALENFYETLRQDQDRAVYGPQEVTAAVEMGAVGTLLVTDALFRAADLATRRKYVELVESVRGQGCKVLVFSSQHVSGEQLAQLSGIAATLRWPCPELNAIGSDSD